MYMIGAASFPNDAFCFIFGHNKVGELFSAFCAKAICCIVPIWLMFELKTENLFKRAGKIKIFVYILPFFAVAANNFPFSPLVGGEAVIQSDVNAAVIIGYVCACFGGVFLEESIFRGLILPTLYRKYSSKKHGVFLAALISSLLFGVTHLVNLLAGASVGAVIMQIGYSFLIGGMCACAMILSGNILYPVALHFIFNSGGLLFTYDIISGSIWNILTISVTAVLGCAVFAYALWAMSKLPDELKTKMQCVSAIKNTQAKDDDNNGC